MKLSHVCLVALVALLSLSSGFVAASELEADMEREVRSYTAEMEYVDHVDLSQSSSDLPVADSATLMETGADSASPAPVDAGMHFVIDNEAEASSEAEAPASDFDLGSFLEQGAEQEVDTDVARAMALEIHDAAQANIDEEGEVAGSSFMELTSSADSEAEAEATMEAEMEAEIEAALEAELEGEPKSAKAKAAKAKRKAKKAARKAKKAVKKALKNAKKFVLSAAERVQEKKDIAAEKAAKIAEAKDNKEAAADAKQAKLDAAILAGNVKTVTLPEDLSASHAETIRVNHVATKTIKGALHEMSAILVSKDDTIRSLVYNISYLTVNIGTLANKVDQQRAYIAMLRAKLHNANRKNKQLHDHVEHSADTVVAVRKQLRQVEGRLNQQDKTTAILSDFLTKHKDTVELPPLANDLVIKGKPVVAPKAAHLARRMRSAIRHKKRKHHGKKKHRKHHRAATHAVTMHPVEGTQVYADSHGNSVPFIAAASFHHQSVSVTPGVPHPEPHVPAHVTPLTHPTYQPPTYKQAEAYHGIPTIVIEAPDHQ